MPLITLSPISLVVTRALGDTVAKRLGVIPDPEVVEIDITPDLAYVVIGSDGVYEGLTNEEVIAVLARHTDPQQASEDLTKESLAAMERIEIDDSESFARSLAAAVLNLKLISETASSLMPDTTNIVLQFA